jgi:DNA-binding NarL/FixJ family response regulator
VEPFSIILCDLNGVGTSLSVETQGAYVIEEIKAQYPDKIVIAYTATPSSSKLAKRAQIAADGYLRKDATIEEWRDLLDSKIKYLSNPIEVWKALRLRLLTKNIELSELIRLEQIVLKNINHDVKTTKAALESELKRIDTSSPWKPVLTKFIESKTFELAFYALSKIPEQS